MEFGAVALTVATLLAKKAAESLSGEAGKEVWGGLRRLYEAVRSKFASDPEGEDVLQRVEAKPDSEGRTKELAEVLENRMEADTEFADHLAGLIAEAEADPQTGRFVTTVRDNAKVGKIVNIGTIIGETKF
jgi:hypothetical protein